MFWIQMKQGTSSVSSLTMLLQHFFKKLSNGLFQSLNTHSGCIQWLWFNSWTVEDFVDVTILSCLICSRRKEGNILFNDALNTFYLRLYGVRYMLNDDSDSKNSFRLAARVLLFVTLVVDHWLEQVNSSMGICSNELWHEYVRHALLMF